MTNRYTLHGTWLSGPTYKVALLLSLLRKRFDYVHVDLRTGKNKEPDYLSKNRFGQVPCLVDRQNQFAICQSGLILDYVAGRRDISCPAPRLSGFARASGSCGILIVLCPTFTGRAPVNLDSGQPIQRHCKCI